jgi:hypothetical protein
VIVPLPVRKAHHVEAYNVLLVQLLGLHLARCLTASSGPASDVELIPSISLLGDSSEYFSIVRTADLVTLDELEAGVRHLVQRVAIV